MNNVYQLFLGIANYSIQNVNKLLINSKIFNKLFLKDMIRPDK